jgi:pyridinium-3,5-biscarboxylic acid mononucleotide synthase
MDNTKLKNILASLRSGKRTLDEALDALKHLPYEDLSFAKIDHHRQIRQGIPEVIFAQGKREEDVVTIARAIFRKNRKLLITKASQAIFKKLKIIPCQA